MQCLSILNVECTIYIHIVESVSNSIVFVYCVMYMTILAVRKIGHLNIKSKIFDIEARVLIGWYSLASQSQRALQS